MNGEFEACIYEENEATYWGMEIAKVNNGEFGGANLDSNNYEGGINHIGISHGRTRAPNEPLAGGERPISRWELQS